MPEEIAIHQSPGAKLVRGRLDMGERYGRPDIHPVGFVAALS